MWLAAPQLVIGSACAGAGVCAHSQHLRKDCRSASEPAQEGALAGRQSRRRPPPLPSVLSPQHKPGPSDRSLRGTPAAGHARCSSVTTWPRGVTGQAPAPASGWAMSPDASSAGPHDTLSPGALHVHLSGPGTAEAAHPIVCCCGFPGTQPPQPGHLSQGTQRLNSHSSLDKTCLCCQHCGLHTLWFLKQKVFCRKRLPKERSSPLPLCLNNRLVIPLFEWQVCQGDAWSKTSLISNN